MVYGDSIAGKYILNIPCLIFFAQLLIILITIFTKKCFHNYKLYNLGVFVFLRTDLDRFVILCG